MVKIKTFRGHGLDDALACYRSRAQFRSGVIVWINARPPELVLAYNRSLDASAVLLEIDAVLRSTLAHEYGHVVAEFARCALPALDARIAASYPDEEEFAEDFARFLADGLPLWVETDFHTEVLCEYRLAAFED